MCILKFYRTIIVDNKIFIYLFEYSNDKLTALNKNYYYEWEGHL